MPKENINQCREPHPKDVRDGNGESRRVEVRWDREVLAVSASRTTADQRTNIHVDLDRDGVNRLIRTLRRARDAAFGTDA